MRGRAGVVAEPGQPSYSLGARPDQAVFVGVDDGLDSIAQPQFVEHPADVRLHGGLGEHQPGGDLGVRQPGATSIRISRSRAVSSSSSGGSAPGPRPAAPLPGAGRCGKNASSSRRVTLGATTASPLATARIAASSSGGGTSFSKNPLAPARSPA